MNSVVGIGRYNTCHWQAESDHHAAKQRRDCWRRRWIAGQKSGQNYVRLAGVGLSKLGS
jgi:hypothetical protein